MPDLAVIVVSWNTRDLLAACLRSVQAAVDEAGLDARLWVVDNASHDGSVEMLERVFAGVRLVPSPLNLGFGGGQNLALRAIGFERVPVPPPVQVGADRLQIPAPPGMDSETGVSLPLESEPPRYVLVLNPDTRIDPGALRAMVAFMDRTPGAGVCGPRLMYGDGSFQHAGYRFPSLAQVVLDFWPINWRLTESWLNGRYPRRLYEAGKPFPIDHPLGAAMLFRREVIEQTGGFDLEYFMYVEEIDWCVRVRRAGWGIYCVPAAEVIHYEGQSTKQVRPQMVVALWRSRYIFYRKHCSPAYRWAVRRIIRAGMRAQMRRTVRMCRSGQIEPSACDALLDAYRQVRAM